MRSPGENPTLAWRHAAAEPMGGAGGVGADQDLWRVSGLSGPGQVLRWQRIEGLAQNGDVIGGGGTAGVARPQTARQGPSRRRDVGAIQNISSDVKPKVASGRGPARVLLVVGMIDGDRWHRHRCAASHRGPGASPCGTGHAPERALAPPGSAQPGRRRCAHRQQPPVWSVEGDRPERLLAISPHNLTDPIVTQSRVRPPRRPAGETPSPGGAWSTAPGYVCPPNAV